MLKPYYQDDAITIFHADCRSILPQLERGSVDLVLTDPPYGISYESGHYKGINPWGSISGDDSWPEDVLQMCRIIARVGVLAFCRWDVKHKQKPDSLIVWVKNSWTAGDLEHEYARSWEAIAWWKGPLHQWAATRPSDVILNSRVAPTALHHPTEKPVELLEKLIQQHKRSTVLDPFMGSGSTLRAAKNLGLKAVGVEIEERYCEIAALRMKQEVLQHAPAADSHKQGGLY